ncbi:RDD family protein [Archangium lansingense]|uniref:RDD family protein n=1 Tax=Archangium lansingense TaxID=2995310 RepID=A0ABT3ZZ99_9BACT|nr:RDD family protein [Archangium lansinium]MCY1074710.1 RDD family protein [Archangium lansinium]
MSKCLKCGASLPPVGDCPTCVAASQPAARAVPSFLDKEIQIDRRRPDRDAPAMPPISPAAAATPPGMTTRAPTPPGMTPAASRQQAPAQPAPRAPGLPVMPPRPQAPAAQQMAPAPAPRPPASAAPVPPAHAQAAAPRPPAPAPRPPAPAAPVPPAHAQAAAPRPPAAPPQAPSFNLPGVAAPAPRATTPAFGVPNAPAPTAAPQQASSPGLPVMPPLQQAPGLPNLPPLQAAAPAPLDLAIEEESFPVDVEESEPAAPPPVVARRPAPSAPAPTPTAAPRLTGSASKETEIHARPASLWRRLLALTIDTGAIAVVAALYLMLASSVAGVHAPQTGLSGIDAFVAQVRALQSVLLPGAALLLVLSLVYCAVSAFLWNGRTLGRRLLGLRLVDTHGLAPAPGRAIVRAMLATLSFGLFLAGFWMALFDRRGQTLHDKLTSTYVVQPS